MQAITIDPINVLKGYLKAQASVQYGELIPCARKATIEDCFQIYNGKLYLYFNVQRDHSTRTLSAPIQYDISAIAA